MLREFEQYRRPHLCSITRTHVSLAICLDLIVSVKKKNRNEQKCVPSTHEIDKKIGLLTFDISLWTENTCYTLYNWIPCYGRSMLVIFDCSEYSLVIYYFNSIDSFRTHMIKLLCRHVIWSHATHDLHLINWLDDFLRCYHLIVGCAMKFQYCWLHFIYVSAGWTSNASWMTWNSSWCGTVWFD